MIDYTEFLTNLANMVVAYAPKVLFALLLLYFGLKIISRGMKVADKLMTRNNFDADLRPFIITLLSALFKILLLLSVAGIMGVETTSFVALLASIGFAIGLALQGSLSNMSSGILILAFKPFRTGDMIGVGSYTGIVKEIQIFNTVLETLDHRRVVVPNKLLTESVVENMSGAGIIRVDVAVGISYQGSIDKARDVVMSVISGCPFALTDEAYQHQVNVRAMDDSAVTLEIWVWAKAEDYWNTFYFMQEYVKKAFDKHGVDIPFPQMDLHLIQNREEAIQIEARQLS